MTLSGRHCLAMGAGDFIGSHLVERIVHAPSSEVYGTTALPLERALRDAPDTARVARPGVRA